jgi:hypothetical protein
VRAEANLFDFAEREQAREDLMSSQREGTEGREYQYSWRLTASSSEFRFPDSANTSPPSQEGGFRRVGNIKVGGNRRFKPPRKCYYTPEPDDIYIQKKPSPCKDSA